MISRSASIVLLALALALTLGACQPDPQTYAEAVAVDLAAEREAVMAPERESSAMYGRGDVEGIAALLADESVLPAPVRPPTVGRDSVVAATRAHLAAEAADGVSVSWEPVDAVVSPSGDMAYDWGRAATTLADGPVVEGSYLVVWTREDGEWKVAADLFN